MFLLLIFFVTCQLYRISPITIYFILYELFYKMISATKTFSHQDTHHFSGGRFLHYHMSKQKYLVWKIIIGLLYYITVEYSSSPIIHTMGTLMLFLGKKHQLFLTNMLHVSWPHIPNEQSLLSVTKRCMHTVFNVIF